MLLEIEIYTPMNYFTAKYIIPILLAIMPSFSAYADSENIYLEIDKAITNSEEYVKKRESRISDLTNALCKATNDSDRYNLSNHLFQEYKPYKSDSAFVYALKSIDYAEKLGDRNKTCISKSNLAFMFSTTGQYSEANDILSIIDTVGVSRAAKGQFLFAKVHVYGELGFYCQVHEMGEQYFSIQKSLLPELFDNLDPNSEDFLLRKEIELYNANDCNGALEINDRRMLGLDEGSHIFAIVAYYRFLILNKAGRKNEAEKWLAKATLNDIRNAVMDQGALWELANILKEKGQLERSRRYIYFAWQCANTFSTRMRNWQITPVLSNIDSTYQKEIEDSNTLLRLLIIIISIMAVALAIGLLYVYRQHKRLSLVHRQLSSKNKEMELLNNELSNANQNLDKTNKQLKSLIEQLNEQTKIKEEYIGHFMRLCSDYIDKIDEFRRKVNRLVKNKDYDELAKLAKSSDLKKQEIEELCISFDNAFLHLFPNFIDDFNALLREDEKIEIQGEYTLNTTLRIFALIRLGIDDSSKIADFLHYSVNTIYNYRARIKSAAINRREDFEQKVKEIGMI